MAVSPGIPLEVGPAPLVAMPRAWIQPGSGGSWIGYNTCGGPLDPYSITYEYAFCLCQGHSGVQLHLDLHMAANSASVYLNGALIGGPYIGENLDPWDPPYVLSAVSPVGITDGLNKLRIVVKPESGFNGILVSGAIGADSGRCNP